MAGEKYTNIGKARWENANVGVIKWDPENKAGLASVIDEKTGTVYEIGGGGGGGDFSTLKMTVTGDTGNFTVYPAAGENSDYECAFLNSDNMFVNDINVPKGESVTVTVIYAGDSAIVSPYNTVKSVTGDATYDQETGLITATGDFTVAGFMDD